MQGVVESIASKNPKELTALLEQISGSDELRREYDELEELKARVVMERKQKKAQKEEAEKHMRLQQELKLLKTEHYLWQLYTIGKDKEKLEADLAEDRQSLQQQPVLLKLKEQISQLKSKIKSYKKEIDKKKDDNKKHLEEMKWLQSALVDVTRPIEELNEQGQDKTGKMQLTDDQLQEYHRIKEDTGMKTAKLRDEKEVIDKKLNADVGSNHLCRITSEKSYSNCHLRGVILRKRLIDLSLERRRLEYEQKRDMNKPIVKLKERHESLEKELKDWKSKSDECDKVIDELKEQNASVAAKLAKLDRQVKSKKGQLMQLISLQREISEKCELEQLKLPTVNDPMDTGSSSQELVLDYSQLSEIYLHDMQPSERDKHEVEFKQKIGSYLAEIERSAPNLKALDQYDALQRKEKEVTEKFETARKEEKEISDKYNSVKQKRYELFMKAFDHISKGIDKIYKQLTESHTHPLGGTTYFNLENEDEPFLHGIEYRVMPPTKRFRDMKQLSGGEKTVAALALLFAIHSFRPSPFFILDEVDAPLDYQPLHKPSGDDKGDAAAAAEKGEGAAGHAPRGLPDDIARRVADIARVRLLASVVQLYLCADL
nr:unnamed protein product [Digitaria exilis]